MVVGVIVEEQAVSIPTVGASGHITAVIGTDTQTSARFAASPVPTVTTDGSGTGATVDSFTVNRSGQITSVTWDSGGSGYATGDEITFTQGTVEHDYTLLGADHTSGALNDLSGKTLGGTHVKIEVGVPTLVRPTDDVEAILGNAGTLHEKVEFIHSRERIPVLCSRHVDPGTEDQKEQAIDDLQNMVPGFPGLRVSTIALTAEDGTYALVTAGDVDSGSATTQASNALVTKGQEVAAAMRAIAFVDAPPDNVTNALAWATSNLSNVRIVGCADRPTIGGTKRSFALVGVAMTAIYDRLIGEHGSIRNKPVAGVSASEMNLRPSIELTSDVVRLEQAGLATMLFRPALGWRWWGGSLGADAPFDRISRRRVADLIYREEIRVGNLYLEGIGSGGDLAALVEVLHSQVITRQIDRGTIVAGVIEPDTDYNTNADNVAAGNIRFVTQLQLHSYIEQITIRNDFRLAAPTI